MRIITLSQLSLAGSSGIAEVKQPIWFADGTTVSTNTSGVYLQDGGGTSTSTTGSAVQLFSLNSQWSPSQKFALEVTTYATSGVTATVRLWDMTSNALVPNTSLSNTSTTATVVRSGQFTLTPSHSYGVELVSNGSSAYISDASLIIFPS